MKASLKAGALLVALAMLLTVLPLGAAANDTVPADATKIVTYTFEGADAKLEDDLNSKAKYKFTTKITEEGLQDVGEDDRDAVRKMFRERFPGKEYYEIDGEQEIYDFIVILE